jgi:Na+/phosphate symporter
MKFLSDYVNEIVVNPLKSSYDLALSKKDEALSKKDEALSKAYAALKNYAKRLLKQGLAKEEVSNETTLPPETVEELSLELGFKN